MKKIIYFNVVLSFWGCALMNKHNAGVKDRVEHLVSLNSEDGERLNALFDKERNSFSFTNKKIGFLTGPSGNDLSDVSTYLAMHEKHSTNTDYPCDKGKLYIFTPKQKAESGGYDAAVVYWCKFLLPPEWVVKRLKGKKTD